VEGGGDESDGGMGVIGVCCHKTGARGQDKELGEEVVRVVDREDLGLDWVSRKYLLCNNGHT